MAAPVVDHYGCASGGVVAGGRTVLPAWLSSTPIGEWVELPNSTLSTSGVGWAGTPPGGFGNYSEVVTAWSGGILNTVGVTYGGAFIAGTFLVLFGGGHGNYAGNELYAYGPLESDTPIWRRLTDPTIPAPEDAARLGGYPVSRHTYDTMVYLPTVNKMLCIGSPGYYVVGYALNVADVFDFSVDTGIANPWGTADTGFPAYNGGGQGTINLLSGYNPATGKAWGVGQGNAQRLGSYDVASGTWSDWYKDNPNGPFNSKAGIDSTNNLMVFVSSGTVYAQDLSNPTSALYIPTVTGTAPAGTVTMDYDAANGRFIAWGDEGKKLYYLTPGANPASGGDAWAWSSTTPAGGATPSASTTNGTFGRFRMKSNGSWRGVVLMPTYNQPICFFRV